jgi:hypothetical protein
LTDVMKNNQKYIVARYDLNASFMLLSIFSDAQSIISIITSMIDIFAIAVVGVTVFASIPPLIKTTATLPLPFLIRAPPDRQTASENYLVSRRVVKENLIRGLLLALELESANAILKMGVFTSGLVGTSTISSSTSTFGISNFIFFVGIFSLRIVINRALRRSK